LVTDDDLPKNALSYFVSRCIDELPAPMCLISYADENHGHHGYIYQATNWYYTGKSEPADFYVDTRTGEEIHSRSMGHEFSSVEEDGLPDYLEKHEEDRPKHRYLYFVGDKKQQRTMKSELKWEIQDYPKGDNEEYDTEHTTRADEFLEKVSNE
jgi:hypothetical protein